MLPLRDRSAANLLAPTAVLLAAAVIFLWSPVLGGVAIVACVAALILFTLEATTAAALLASAAIALMVMIPAGRFSPGSPYVELNRIVPIAVLMLALVGAMRCRVAHSPSVWTFFCAQGMVSALGTALSPDPGEWQVLFLTQSTIASAILIVGFVAAEDAWQKVARGIVVVAVAESIIAVVEYFTFSQPLWRSPADAVAPGAYLDSGFYKSQLVAGAVRAQGTLGHPLPLSFLLLLALVIHLRGNPLRVARWAPTSILVVGLAAAGSRNALLICLALLITRGGQRLGSRLVFGGLALCAGTLWAWPTLHNAYETLVRSGSVTHRMGAIQSLTNLVAHRDWPSVLVGDGVNSLQRLYSAGLLQVDGLQAVDNQWVLLIAQTGIIGLALYIWLFVLSLRRTDGVGRALLAVVLVEFFIFDALNWYMSALLIMLITVRGVQQTGGAQVNIPGTPAQRALGADPVADNSLRV